MFHGIFKIMMKRLEKRKKVEGQNMSFHSSKLPKNGFDTACIIEYLFWMVKVLKTKHGYITGSRLDYLRYAGVFACG